MADAQTGKATKLTPGRKSAVSALLTQVVPINEHCVGDRWIVQDIDQLAKLTAIVAMGQASYAAYIIRELLPATPAFTHADRTNEGR